MDESSEDYSEDGDDEFGVSDSSFDSPDVPVKSGLVPLHRHEGVKGKNRVIAGSSGGSDESHEVALYSRRVSFYEPAPAYQEYASRMLASQEFRALSLAEVGLLYRMRLECWPNRSVPSDPTHVARIIGQPIDDVISAWSGQVMRFFIEHDGRLFSPDLEEYRQRITEKREKQSDGAKQTNEKRKRRKTK